MVVAPPPRPIRGWSALPPHAVARTMFVISPIAVSASTIWLSMPNRMPMCASMAQSVSWANGGQYAKST